jgi:hypothetical protein
MSLDYYIRWCKCNRRILTTQQIKEDKVCEICQQEQGEKTDNIHTIADIFNGG